MRQLFGLATIPKFKKELFSAETIWGNTVYVIFRSLSDHTAHNHETNTCFCNYQSASEQTHRLVKIIQQQYLENNSRLPYNFCSEP